MAVFRKTARVLVTLLAVALLVTTFVTPADAINMNKTTIFIKTRVADKYCAGTDSDIYFKVYYINGESDKFKLDKKGNDFERNKWGEYEIKIDYPMWFVKSFGLKNSGKDAMCLAYISARMHDPDNKNIERFTSAEPGSYWIEKGNGDEYEFDSVSTKRSLNDDSYADFKTNFSQKVYVTSSSSGEVKVNWTKTSGNGEPKLNSDGYGTGKYNPYFYKETPTLSYAVQAVASSNKWVTALGSRFTPISGTYKDKGYQIGYSYKPSEIYSDMVSAGYNVVKIDTTWSFPTRSTSGTTSKTYSYYIYRKTFELGEPKVETAFYTALKDNYFFNSGSTGLRITVPVKDGLYYSNYDAANVARTFKTLSGSGYIKLFFGPGTNDYFTPTKVSSSNNNIILDFDLTKKQYQDASGSSGLKLVMKDVYAQPGSNFPDAGDYGVYDKQSFSGGSVRTINIGSNSITLGDASYYRDLSKYKLDNISPSIVVTEDGYNGSGLSGSWKSSLTIATTVDGNEQLFPRLNPNGDAGNEKERGLFDVTVLKADGRTVVPLKGANSSGTVRVPVKSGTKTVLNPSAPIEAADLILRVTGYDFAGNKFTKDIPGVHLDNIAPSMNLTREDRGQAQDGSKSILYRFGIQEGSGTGRVNYCFVKKNDPIPATTGAVVVSGVVESTVGKWAYVEQGSIADAAAVLKMSQGSNFDGYLYYYAIDAAGNQTPMKSAAVAVSNENAGASVSVASYSHPLPDYNITIVPDANCEVYYRYSTVSDDGSISFSRAYVKYDGKTNPGNSSGGVTSASGTAAVSTRLNGPVILEYKVVNKSSGNVAYFEGGLGIPLVFDNSEPSVSITQNTKGQSLASHAFTVSASDISGVASASYKVCPAGSTAAAASGSIDMSAGSGVLNTVLNTSSMDLANGSYELSVTVIDSNGVSATAVSDPFSVRTSAPSAEVQLNGAVPAGLNYVTNIDYNVDLNVSDSFAGTPGAQSVFWRASYDGSGYTPWQKLADLTAGSGTLSKQASLGTPLALTEGLNDVYIQLACAENTKNLSKEGPVAGSILTLEPLHFMLDTEAPSLRWNMVGGRNNTAVVGTLAVSDNMTPAPEVTSDSLNVTITASESLGVYDVVYAVPAGGTQEPSFTLTVTDECGNSASAVVSTETLDFEAPVITISGPNYSTVGDQKDAVLNVTVTDQVLGNVNFIFSEDAAMYSEVTGNGSGSYTVRMHGFNSDSASLTVEAADDLGNTSVSTKSGISVAYPDTIELVRIVSQPLYAIDSAPLVLEFNKPVAVGKDATEAAINLEKTEAGSTLSNRAAYTFVTSDTSNESTREFTIWAMGEFGTAQSVTVSPTPIFGKDFDIDLELKQSVDGAVSSVTNDSASYLVNGIHVADPSVPGDEDHVYSASVVISTESEIVGPNPDYESTDPQSEEEIILAGQSLQAFTILTAGDSRIVYNTSGEAIDVRPEDYDSKENLFVFNYDARLESRAFDNDFNAFGLASMGFDLSDEASLNQSGAQINIGLIYNDAAGLYSGGLMTDPEAEPNFQEVYVRYYTYDWDDETDVYTYYTAGQSFDLLPDAIWLNKTIDINPKIIVTGPSIEFGWRQSSLAPEAIIEADADGRGCEISLLKLLRKEGNNWVVAAEYSEAAADDESMAASLKLVTTEAGIYCVYAENEGGLSAVSDELTVEIYENPIQASDFSVSVLIDKAGNGSFVANDGSFARSAKAVMTPTVSGAARGIHVANCNGENEFVFNEQVDSFIFDIEDNFGYSTKAAVSFSRFDVTAPEVIYELANTAKTNQPYDIVIEADDAESGIAGVTLQSAGAAQTITPSGMAATLTPSGLAWTGSISKNGSYLLTVTDNIGNRTQRTFTVSNIDTVKPAVSSEDRSVPEDTLTQQTVDVRLNFSKPNVTITTVEKASGRYTVDKDNATLTFSENGAASVFFRDDYGNEGSYLVTVNNIYSDIPTLVAIPTLSDDELSVSVRFEQQKDGTTGTPLDRMLRPLSDFTVMQNGLAYSAADAKFILRDNGNYTFTVIDQAGLTQMITLTVTDIDRAAPKITEVSWNYVYANPDGTTSSAIHSISNVTGAAYVIADDVYPRTYNPVTVTVKTDAQTSIVGAQDAQKQTDHTLVYNENGMFIFNLEKANGLSTSYGVDVEIIDKEKPVITLNGGSQLMYVEGKATGSIRAMVTSFSAIDTFRGIDTDLTAQVEVDFGGLNVDSVQQNTFDKNRPYTVTYTVKDAAGNQATVTRMVLLIGINDVLVTVNGELPDASFMAEVQGGNVRLDMVNFSGKVYCNYAQGMNSFGQMKTKGTFIAPDNGSFTVSGLETGWYTFFVQTEMRDYFNIYVYVK